jgi:hypothetical protein
MEKNVLCYNADTDTYQSIYHRIITPEWMKLTGYKPVEVPQEKPLLCEEIKKVIVPLEVPELAPMFEKAPTHVNKGGRPKKEEKLN